MVAVVILLHEFQRECRGGGNKLSNVRSFCILQSGKVLASFKTDNIANFSGEKKSTVKSSGVSIFDNTRKNFKSILVVVVVLVLESKGLFSEVL